MEKAIKNLFHRKNNTNKYNTIKLIKILYTITKPKNTTIPVYKQ